MTSAFARSTSWLERARSALERDAAVKDLPHFLRLVDQGVQFRRRLLRSGEPDLVARAAEVEETVISLRARVLADLSAAEVDAEVRDRVRAQTERRLEGDHAEFTQLVGSPDLDQARRVGLLNQFRLDLLVLGERVAWLDDQPVVQPSVSARIELNRLADLIRQKAGDGLSAWAERLEESTERLRRRLLDQRRERLLNDVATVVDDPVQSWIYRFQLSRLLAELVALPALPGNQPFDPIIERTPSVLVPTIRDATVALAANAHKQLKALDADARARATTRLLEVARAEAQDVLALAEDLPPAEAVELLQLTSDDLELLRDQVRGLVRESADSRTRIRRDSRWLRSIAGTLRGEWQEKALAERLRQTFGARFVRAFDALILLLILVLTAAIIAETFIEMTGRMTPVRLRFFARLDLAICIVFLTEFTLKWSMARGKWRYFRRHALLDLLPSIPFGFLAYEVSALVGAERVQLLRLLRVPRLLRYLRLAQPLVRILRLVVFLFRFSDRLVRRYANLFNRNIILFEPVGSKDQESRVRHLYTDLRRQVERRFPEQEAALSPEQTLAVAERALEDLGRWIEQTPIIDHQTDPGSTTSRDIRMERLVENLIELTPDELVERMGTEFTVSVDQIIRLFDAPVVRRLPIVNELVAQREKGPAESATLAANILGSQLQRLLDVVYFVADLQATVSPPLFLDKLGRTIVNATRRPAFRLVSLGLVFIALWAFLHVAMPERVGSAAAEAGWVRRSLRVIESFTYTSASKLGPAVIALGVVCGLLMFLGNWLRRIANQTSEFSERVVEAQFSTQTKQLKRHAEPRDLRFIGHRVILPELRLRTADDRDGSPTSVKSESIHVEGASFGLARDFDLSPGEAAFLHNLRLLYDDFLDGPPFHRTDTKTSTQLLGNLALQNLNRSSLVFLLGEARRIQRLDLNRAVASVLGGPYLWFDYITRLIVQQTARLLVDFNRNAVPVERLASSPHAVRQRYRSWLARRLGVPEAEVDLPDPIGILGDRERPAPPSRRRASVEFYETVEFSAVDFLGPKPDRDETLKSRFGPQVLCLVKRERERNLRRAFRSFPLHRAPVDRRTVNFFYLYERFLASGRVVILPFRLLYWSFQGAAYSIRRVTRTTRELLRPSADRPAPDELDTFAAAMRKIHRMRKPAFMESLWMRARFDVEYLGLPLPSIPISVGSGSLMETDLDFIGASRHERILAERFRERERERLRLIELWLDELHWRLEDIGPFLQADFPHLADRGAEVVRAIVAACLVDHDDLYSLAASISAIRAIFQFAADPSNDLRRLPPHLPAPLLSNRRLWYGFGKDRPRLEALFNVSGLPSLDDEAKRRVLRLLRRHRGRTRGWVRVLLAQGGPDPVATLRTRMLDVILRADLWSEQILVLRMVQTLTMLDLQHYAELVWVLGAYEAMGDFSHRPTLPFTAVQDDQDSTSEDADDLSNEPGRVDLDPAASRPGPVA